jgi:hypothetical protein
MSNYSQLGNINKLQNLIYFAHTSFLHVIFTSPMRKSALKQQGASERPSVNNKKRKENHCYSRNE